MRDDDSRGVETGADCTVAGSWNKSPAEWRAFIGLDQLVWNDGAGPGKPGIRSSLGSVASRPDGCRLYDLFTTARVAATRDDGEVGPHTLVCTQSQREALREQCGTEEAQDLITRTTGFVQPSPRLQKLIEKGALGSHPEFVALLVERVLSAASVAFGQPSPDGATDAAAASAS